MSDFLHHSIRSDLLSISKIVPGTCFKWSRAESLLWHASEMHCGTSGGITTFVWDGCDQLWQPRRSRDGTPTDPAELPERL